VIFLFYLSFLLNNLLAKNYRLRTHFKTSTFFIGRHCRESINLSCCWVEINAVVAVLRACSNTRPGWSLLVCSAAFAFHHYNRQYRIFVDTDTVATVSSTNGWIAACSNVQLQWQNIIAIFTFHWVSSGNVWLHSADMSGM
jgi:hypothetical protein